MTRCDIHRWERYELRDEGGVLYYVGYRCPWCGEPGYVLDMAESSGLGPARGILTGLFLGIAAWAVVLSVLGLFR